MENIDFHGKHTQLNNKPHLIIDHKIPLDCNGEQKILYRHIQFFFLKII